MRRWRSGRAYGIAGLALLVAGLAEAAAVNIERVSVSSTGQQANDANNTPVLSENGQFVVFTSRASNLVPGDTNGVADIFIRNRQSGQIERVSVSSSGAQGNRDSFNTAISNDGRFVAFASLANNLTVGDDNGIQPDIFVRDRQTGMTELVSVSSTGALTNGGSSRPSISDDGRFVAFNSAASTLTPGDTNNEDDIFVHDRQTRTTQRVSVSSTGELGNGLSSNLALSGNGQTVAFASSSSNLVPGDTNDKIDIFVHDLATRTTERISVNSAGQQGDDHSQDLSISEDGQVVAFQSFASNLAPGDTNGRADIFVHDRRNGVTERVSVSSAGVQANLSSFKHAISDDGRSVVFLSQATNLVPGDTNGAPDVFLHNRQTRTTERMSVNSSGMQGNSESYEPAISGDGRFVAFASLASNLVAGDTNGTGDVFVAQLGAPQPPPPTEPALESVSVSPNPARAGGRVTVTLRLTAAAPGRRGAAIPVTVTKDGQPQPVRVSVRVRGTTGVKRVKLSRRLAAGTYNFSATFGGVTKTTALTVS
ncbi:MAG TPA: hypothetical protein VK689_06140, partial [Armatimonadota bacterium]|nr:hypothetical protein [Armatimonadota bacterium]